MLHGTHTHRAAKRDSALYAPPPAIAKSFISRETTLHCVVASISPSAFAQVEAGHRRDENSGSEFLNPNLFAQQNL
jgi:hypothetical protein